MSTEQKTVTVVIAVAVDDKGGWRACGGSDLDEKDSIQEAIDNVQDASPARIFFVKCDLPLPTPQVVDGSASESEPQILINSYREYYNRHAENLQRISGQYQSMIDSIKR